MKNLKLLPVVFLLIFSFSFISCDKDDDVTSTKLISVSYKPNNITGKLKTAFKSSELTLNPVSAKATFSITGITKDKAKFTNPTKGFKVDLKGKISAESAHILAAGTYVLTITAKDKSDSKNTKTTTLTVKIN